MGKERNCVLWKSTDILFNHPTELWSLCIYRYQSHEAAVLFNQGMSSLKKLLPLFDNGSGSNYDLRHFSLGVAPNIARWDYHATHVNQLLLLATIDNSTILSATADRWIGYMAGKKAQHNWWCRGILFWLYFLFFHCELECKYVWLSWFLPSFYLYARTVHNHNHVIIMGNQRNLKNHTFWRFVCFCWFVLFSLLLSAAFSFRGLQLHTMGVSRTACWLELLLLTSGNLIPRRDRMIISRSDFLILTAQLC